MLVQKIKLKIYNKKIPVKKALNFKFIPEKQPNFGKKDT